MNYSLSVGLAKTKFLAWDELSFNVGHMQGLYRNVKTLQYFRGFQFVGLKNRGIFGNNEYRHFLVFLLLKSFKKPTIKMAYQSLLDAS